MCAILAVFGLLSNTPRVLLPEIYKFVLIEDSLEENVAASIKLIFSDDSQPLTIYRSISAMKVAYLLCVYVYI